MKVGQYFLYSQLLIGLNKYNKQSCLWDILRTIADNIKIYVFLLIKYK